MNHHLITVTGALKQYESLSTALTQCIKIEEVLDFRDKLDLLKLRARQAMNRELEITATEMRVRATRRCGQLIEAIKEENGLRKGKVRNPRDKRVRLADFGIPVNAVPEMTRLAKIGDDDFEKLIANWRRRCAEKSGRRLPSVEDFESSNWRANYLADPYSLYLGMLGMTSVDELRRFNKLYSSIIRFAGNARTEKVRTVVGRQRLLGWMREAGFPNIDDYDLEALNRRDAQHSAILRRDLDAAEGPRP